MQVKSGNIFSEKSGFIIHGCNAQGIMGSGIAKQVVDLYPEAYQHYRAGLSETNLLNSPNALGRTFSCPVTNDMVIINAITQLTYANGPGDTTKGKGRFVNYEAVAQCFEKVSSIMDLYPNIKRHLYFPAIGAGLARGKWSILQQIILESTSEDKTFYIYK